MSFVAAVPSRSADFRKVYRTKSATWSPPDPSTSSVQRGEVFGLLGPKGRTDHTGQQLIGLLRPDAGTIELFGHDVVAQRASSPIFRATSRRTTPRWQSVGGRLHVDPTARLRGCRAPCGAGGGLSHRPTRSRGVAGRPIASVEGQRRSGRVRRRACRRRPVLVPTSRRAGLRPDLRASPSGRPVPSAVARIFSRPPSCSSTHVLGKESRPCSLASRSSPRSVNREDTPVGSNHGRPRGTARSSPGAMSRRTAIRWCRRAGAGVEHGRQMVGATARR